MKNCIIILFVLLVSGTAKSQTGYYNSYRDYLKDSMQVMKDISRVSAGFGKFTVIFENNAGKEEKVKAKSMWGFKYKGNLFRSDHVGNIAKVVATGDLVYYENGGAHLEMLRYDRNEGDFNSGYACYLSKDLGSEMSPIPSAPISDAKKLYKEFKEKHPEFKSLYDCIGKKTFYLNVRNCVQSYLQGK